MSRVKRVWRRLSSPRARDVLAIIVSALFSCVQALEVWSESSTPVGASALALALLAVASLWWRRQVPLGVTVFTLAACAIGSFYAPAMFALATLAVRRRDRVLLVTAAGGVLCLSVPEGWHEAWQVGQLVQGVVAVMMAVLIGAYVGARRDLLASLRDRADRAEQERELRADQARTAERARIAREMHDVLAHKVSLIALQAGALEVRPDRSAQDIAQTAALIRTTARATLEDLRGVLGVLRADPTAPLAPQPTLADIGRLVDESRAAGVEVAATLPDVATSGSFVIPDAVGRTAFRVVQEALTNVHKHARGARTTVEVAADPMAVTVLVRNVRPVAAGSLLPGSGAGLTGLQERVDLAGGTLQAGPTRDGGWQVLAVLPVFPVPAPVHGSGSRAGISGSPLPATIHR